jgi:hypothetical protein
LILTRRLCIKAILATQFNAFEKGRWRLSNIIQKSTINEIIGPIAQSQYKSLLGDGIFNAEGMPITFPPVLPFQADQG